MNESEEKTVLASLKLQLNKLINRFDEQRGIIDSYVKRERDWKSSKLKYTKEIDLLNDQVAELSKKVDINEWDGDSRIKNFWKRY